MADGTLTFVVPVRDPRGVGDWRRVKEDLSQTLRSLSRVGGSSRIVVAASLGADLPGLPPNADLVQVKLPYSPLPRLEGPERHAAVRADKGRRILAGLAAVRPEGHVMVVDYDDFVSWRLGRLVASSPNCAGWIVDQGIIYDGSRFVLEVPRGFNSHCGTSLIVRADLLRIPRQVEDADIKWVMRSLGSHRFLASDLADWGTPLVPVPFAAAAYRIGNPDSTSPTSSLLATYLSPIRLLRSPKRWLNNVRHLRQASAYREEFSLP